MERVSRQGASRTGGLQRTQRSVIFSLKPRNAPNRLAVRIFNATGLSGVAPGSLPELDIDILRAVVSIAASDPSTRLP